VRFLPIKLDMVCIVAKVLICMVWKINISEKLEEWVQITNFLLAVRLFSWPFSCSFFLQQVSLCICSDLCFASPIQCPTYSLRKNSKKIILVFYDLEVYIQLQFYSWSH
jgi:hypothetical protein